MATRSTPGFGTSFHRQYRDTFVRYGNHPAFPVEFFIEAGALLGTADGRLRRLHG
jgi:hypothetical protein